MSVILETVDYYCSNGGVVYGLALDAAKAFDMVKHNTLFNLLMTRTINPLYIRILFCCFCKSSLFTINIFQCTTYIYMVVAFYTLINTLQ